MWIEASPVLYAGEHHELNDFYCEPKPDGIPVLVDGGEQLTLLGTDYEAIEKAIANTTVRREDTEAAHEAYEALTGRTEAGPTLRDEDRCAVGTPAEVAERLDDFRAAGADTYRGEPCPDCKEKSNAKCPDAV